MSIFIYFHNLDFRLIIILYITFYTLVFVYCVWTCPISAHSSSNLTPKRNYRWRCSPTAQTKSKITRFGQSATYESDSSYWPPAGIMMILNIGPNPNCNITATNTSTSISETSTSTSRTSRTSTRKTSTSTSTNPSI